MIIVMEKRSVTYFVIALQFIGTFSLISQLESALDTKEEIIFNSWKNEIRNKINGEDKSWFGDDGGLSMISNMNNSIEGGRNPKFLSIFTIIQFQNKECSGSSGNGVCYTSTECSDLGGTDTGSCAYGYGTCCYFETTCGTTTSQNVTHLISPGYPDTYTTAMTCEIKFYKQTDTCQIRMDFESFSSAQPTLEGVCSTDYFTVDKDRKFEYLCGEAPTDWHFYLDVNQHSNPITFSFTTTGTTTARKFKIKLTMIECSKRVPGGCGQYFTTTTGTIQSFNYNSGGVYMAGLNYAICLRKEANKCKVTLTRLGDSFVSCPDLYRMPIGHPPTGLLSLNQQPGYCQEFQETFLETATTTTNGPVNIYFVTQYDFAQNLDYFSYQLKPVDKTLVSGVSQGFTQLPC